MSHIPNSQVIKYQKQRKFQIPELGKYYKTKTIQFNVKKTTFYDKSSFFKKTTYDPGQNIWNKLE